MSWSILPVVLFSAFTLPLVLLRRHVIRQGKAVAHHFNGRFEGPFADAIIFHYRSRLFSLKRMASKGGLGGTGSYPALCAFLQHETDLVIADDHSPYQPFQKPHQKQAQVASADMLTTGQQKVIRVGFYMPQQDYRLINEARRHLFRTGLVVTKSAILRAGGTAPKEQ